MRAILLSIAVATVVVGCNPADPYCDPGTPCVGDNEVCNYALKRCEKNVDAAVDVPDAAKPDAAKPDAAKPDAAKPDAAKPDAAADAASDAPRDAAADGSGQ